MEIFNPLADYTIVSWVKLFRLHFLQRSNVDFDGFFYVHLAYLKKNHVVGSKNTF